MPGRQRDSVRIWIRWLVRSINRRIFTSCDRCGIYHEPFPPIFSTVKEKWNLIIRDPGEKNAGRWGKNTTDRPIALAIVPRAYVHSKAANRDYHLRYQFSVISLQIANCSVNHEPSYTVITMRKLSRSAGDGERRATASLAWIRRVSANLASLADACTERSRYVNREIAIWSLSNWRFARLDSSLVLRLVIELDRMSGEPGVQDGIRQGLAELDSDEFPEDWRSFYAI